MGNIVWTPQRLNLLAPPSSTSFSHFLARAITKLKTFFFFFFLPLYSPYEGQLSFAVNAIHQHPFDTHAQVFLLTKLHGNLKQYECIKVRFRFSHLANGGCWKFGDPLTRFHNSREPLFVFSITVFCLLFSKTRNQINWRLSLKKQKLKWLKRTNAESQLKNTGEERARAL